MTSTTATQPQSKTLLTAEEIWSLPENGNRYELVRGELVKMPPAAAEHGIVTGTLYLMLGGYIRTNGLGVTTIAESGYILSRNPDTLRAPDIAFVSKVRIGSEGVPQGFWEIAPDLAVEIVSPSERPGEVQSKVDDYLSAGTRMVWIVHPGTRSLTVYRAPDQARVLTVNDTLSGEDVVPGFTCEVKAIFS
jgi:Uma2 family endonuclease